jgi:selenocysteine lyase/cysteine desulfurase
VRRRLWERRIEAVIGEWPDGLMPRVSTHFYNTRVEVDQLAEALPGIINS